MISYPRVAQISKRGSDMGPSLQILQRPLDILTALGYEIILILSKSLHFSANLGCKEGWFEFMGVAGIFQSRSDIRRLLGYQLDMGHSLVYPNDSWISRLWENTESLE